MYKRPSSNTATYKDLALPKWLLTDLNLGARGHMLQKVQSHIPLVVS